MGDIYAQSECALLHLAARLVCCSPLFGRAYALDVMKGIPMRLNTEVPTEGHVRRKMPTNQKSEEEVRPLL